MSPDQEPMTDAQLGAHVRKHLTALRRMSASSAQQMMGPQNLAYTYACSMLLLEYMQGGSPDFESAQITLTSPDPGVDNWKILISRSAASIAISTTHH